MATTLIETCPLLSTPLNAAMDFTVLADYREHIAESLNECDDLTFRLALCGRLSSCLGLLKSTLNDPIPDHLTESLTEDFPPDTANFNTDTELLCDYCLALSQLLAGRSLSRGMEKTLTGLLAELVWYLAAELKAPRWIRTADGVKSIDEEAV